ncbi:MAG TPA: glycosyltransferase [Terriglobia bacterium]|nr:glycosyltransferase [Terriglobia bacterium]
MTSSSPIVMISSYPPRLCGIGTFTEEAREFIQKANPDREVLVISHTDGRGEGVFPIIDMSRHDWWKPVAEKIKELNPYAVHLEHEYGLYEYVDPRGRGDGNEGFISLLDAIDDYATVVEPHTIHGRLTDFEANFAYQVCQRASVVLFKCHYQKWRLDWNFVGRGWNTPRNIMVVPHGSRPDRRWGTDAIPSLRREIGLDESPYIGQHIVGLVGWIQSNKRWDILTSMWEDIHSEICARSGQEWDLLAAGTMRDPHDLKEYESYRKQVELLEGKGLAHYFEFIPRGDIYYKVMAICDFIVLPSVDETQSGTLARIIALNKPFITTAPMEGLTAQTLESKGGFLFTTKAMLREKVIELACDEGLRMQLGENLKKYLEEVVSWEVVAGQYKQAYELARESRSTGKPVELPLEF